MNKLTKEKFEAILSKTRIAFNCIGIDINESKDLYDLLYQTGGDYDWGVIRYYDYLYMADPIVSQLFSNFSTIKDLIDEDNLKTRREILNKIKAGQHQEIIENYYFDEIDDGSYKDWLESLFDLETELQDYIIEHTQKDVRKQIKDYQSNIDDDIDEALYDDEQIEALQILHEAIRDKKLSIFDPLNYDYIIRRV